MKLYTVVVYVYPNQYTDSTLIWYHNGELQGKKKSISYWPILKVLLFGLI